MQKRAVTSAIQHNLIHNSPWQRQVAEVALKIKKAVINGKEGDKTFSKAFITIIVPCENRKRFKMKQPS